MTEDTLFDRPPRIFAAPQRIAIVITARASFARVQTVIEQLRGKCHLQIVTAGSATMRKFGRVFDHEMFQPPNVPNYGFNEIRYEVPSLEGHSQADSVKATAMLTASLVDVFAFLKPDKVLVIADRYETLAVSIAASYQGVPLYHLLAGERSGNIDDKVRFANTAFADYLITPTVQAAEQLINMGYLGERVFATGCPSVDLAVRASTPSEECLNDTGIGFSNFYLDRPYVMALYHPTPADASDTMQVLIDTLRDYAYEYKTQIAWFWPNIDPGHDELEKVIRQTHTFEFDCLRFYRHLIPERFLGLLKGAKFLIGNSSVGVREAGALGVPVIDLGYRQGRRVRTRNVICVEHAHELTTKKLATVADYKFEPDFTYGHGQAGAAVADVLLYGDGLQPRPAAVAPLTHE